MCLEATSWGELAVSLLSEMRLQAKELPARQVGLGISGWGSRGRRSASNIHYQKNGFRGSPGRNIGEVSLAALPFRVGSYARQGPKEHDQGGTAGF